MDGRAITGWVKLTDDPTWEEDKRWSPAGNGARRGDGAERNMSGKHADDFTARLLAR